MKKKKQTPEKPEMEKQDEVEVFIEEETAEETDRFWLIGTIAVTAIATFLRFVLLELKPLHHDEGVNGHFLITLFRDGIYKYDPSNYHGPTLYFNTLAFVKTFGLETFSVRSSVAIYGVLIVLAVCFLWRYLGKVGSVSAGLFLALSPGMVYISRYFIHEIMFVFFSLGVVIGILYFLENRPAGTWATASMALLLLICFIVMPYRLPQILIENGVLPEKLSENFLLFVKLFFFLAEGVLVFVLMRILLNWKDGRAVYLLLASASMSLFFATKETAFITLGTMIIAIFCVWMWRKFYVAFMGEIKNDINDGLTFENFRKNWSESTDLILLITATLAVFIVVFVVFFTSFFTYSEGISKAFEAYAFWSKTSGTDHTQNGYLGYAKWLLKIESPILVLSAIGVVIAFIRGNNRFALFTALWAFGLGAAYSIIPYKTPWLALSFTLPMCMIAGYGINELLLHREKMVKIFGGFILALGIGVLSYQTIEINFFKYDDDTVPYVYAHTQRGFLELDREIKRFAEKSGKGKEATIAIVSPDYWPMPWYFREYPQANFHGTIVPVNSAEMIISSTEQAEQVAVDYTPYYEYVGKYPLRPGVELELYVRKDLAEKK